MYHPFHLCNKSLAYITTDVHYTYTTFGGNNVISLLTSNATSPL